MNNFWYYRCLSIKHDILSNSLLFVIIVHTNFFFFFYVNNNDTITYSSLHRLPYIINARS